jgi:tRNA dimethylallyltransferase
LQSLVDNYDFSETKPDKEERSLLEKKSIKDLIFILKNIKPGIEDELDENDLGNKRRLIRYIQILKNNKDFSIKKSLNSKNKYNFLLLGLTFPREVLNERIYKRLIQRIEKEGMIDEVKKLHENGVSWERMESFGLEYKHLSWYLNDKIFYVEMVEKLNIAIRQFAKRQMSWFRRWEKQGREIKWVDNTGEANNEIVNKFLSK